MNENKTVDERVSEIREKISDFDSKLYAPGVLAFLDLLVSCAVVKSNLKPLVKVFVVMGLFDDMDRQLIRRRNRKNQGTNCNTIGFSDSNEETKFTDKEVLGFRD